MSHQIVRMTMGYSVNQDRIYSDCLLSDGSRLRLWLTRRLVSRLTEYLNQKLASDSCTPHVALDALMKTGHPTKPQEDPVRCAREDPCVLVVAVDVTSNARQTTFTWRNDDAGLCAHFSLAHQRAAVWIAGLQSCFAVAGWQVPTTEHRPLIAPHLAESVLH